MTTGDDKVMEQLTTDAERGEAMIAKCEAALKALEEAHSACDTLLDDLKKVLRDPERRHDQKLAAELISEASDFEYATKNLRIARALLAYATRPD